MWKHALLILLAVRAQPAVADPQRIDLGDRYYLVDLPARPGGAMILVLHGANNDPAHIATVTGFGPPAMAEGYAVIYPAGTGAGRDLYWNAGYCCGPAVASGVDDVAFLDSVIADAAKRFSLDPARAYITGMSNGAMMAETYAVRRPDTIKAVAGVSGTLDLKTTPPQPVPLLHIHGTADAVVPYDGGKGRSGTVDFTGVAAEVAAFLAAEPGLTKSSRDIDGAEDGFSVREDDYRDAAGTTQLRLLTINGGHHTWPAPALGSRPAQGTQDISATAEVLRFFDEHP